MLVHVKRYIKLGGRFHLQKRPSLKQSTGLFLKFTPVNAPLRQKTFALCGGDQSSAFGFRKLKKLDQNFYFCGEQFPQTFEKV